MVTTNVVLPPCWKLLALPKSLSCVCVRDHFEAGKEGKIRTEWKGKEEWVQRMGEKYLRNEFPVMTGFCRKEACSGVCTRLHQWRSQYWTNTATSWFPDFLKRANSSLARHAYGCVFSSSANANARMATFGFCYSICIEFRAGLLCQSQE